MIVAQNNRFGTVAKIEGALMEFATEDEANEYKEEHESFAEILQEEIQKRRRQ